MHTDMDQDDARTQQVMAMIAAATRALEWQRQWLEDLTGIALQPKEKAPQDGHEGE